MGQQAMMYSCVHLRREKGQGAASYCTGLKSTWDFSFQVVLRQCYGESKQGSLLFFYIFFFTVIGRKCPQEHLCFYGYKIVSSCAL